MSDSERLIGRITGRVEGKGTIVPIDEFLKRAEGVIPWEPGVQINPSQGKSSDTIDFALIEASSKRIIAASARYHMPKRSQG